MNRLEAALGTSKPFSSVSVWIDRLSSEAYKEDDYEGIIELVDAINIQSTGPAEASRALRKKLKYGSVHGQKRALTMLRATVENGGPRYQTSFADPQLVERIKLMSQDPLVDASVRKKLMRLLLQWQIQYKSEPTMRHVAGLYAACGGGRKSDAQLKSEAAEAFRKRKEEEDRQRQIRSDQKAAQRLQKEEDKRKAKQRGNQPRVVFNFEKEKPQILSSLATSQQAATSLVNALQHVNREKENVSDNERVKHYLAAVKAERKKIVRYVQLVRDEEFLGGLISANDQIILSLQLYDKLLKPADVDSDDEPLAAISNKTAAQREQERIAAEDAEIEIVRKRIADAHLDLPEGQLDQLQDRQRMRIERHNSYRSSIRSGVEGGHSGPVRDLIDLDFDAADSHSAGQATHHTRGHTGTLKAAIERGR
ncbi:Cytosolic sorting protein GGA2/TOM1 [Ceraceosorus bombacis]|uniref:Cytosolic sorting protein GGA2/TOM1 n=1 Tax=Ceraceosorus bombacis TaxID=401625 RepID=A0A0P1BHD5_9BASI|nr:Cytosolic sorting protein GGA2/TOM1 [Ceraceosorus bombacis]